MVLSVSLVFMMALNCITAIQIRDDGDRDDDDIHLGGNMVAAVLAEPNPEACRWPANCDPHLERLKLMQVPIPRFSAGQALVRVAASSLNPQDWEAKQYDGDNLPHPLRSGLDWSGTVEQVDSNCEFKAGDKVYGLGCGGYGEYLIHPCANMGKMPEVLSFAEAAALPAAALTSLTAMQSAGGPWKPRDNVTVLVLGGSGGTGHMGIRLAKLFGATKVIATASPSHFDVCFASGADEVIDYHTKNWWEVLRPGSVQVVYNCGYVPDAFRDLSGDHAYEILSKGGTFVSLNPGEEPSDEVKQRRPLVKSMAIGPDTSTKQMDLLSELVQSKWLRPKVDRIYGLDELPKAFGALREHNVSGKIVIEVASNISMKTAMSLPLVRWQTSADC